MKKSLNAIKSKYADANYQVEFLANTIQNKEIDLAFSSRLKKDGLFPLKSKTIEVFQINLGKMCNQVCKHCHVDAGPDRKEIMTRETMQHCLDALRKSNAHTVDLTGGAPEMNPDFRWFVEALSALGKKVIVRCNLTIIVANKKYYDLPEFFKKHNIEVVSSLPYFNENRTDAQRGLGVFSSSIKALKMLNDVGYGVEGTGLNLHLVYNPGGAYLPGSEAALQTQFKRKLKQKFDIHFNNLYAITNLPVSRFLDYLIASGNFIEYMEKLTNAYNTAAAENVMCRNTVSIGWDGFIYDCDFNQMLELKVDIPSRPHVSEYNEKELENREIIVNQHCYGCTAGAGSSCGGSTA
jgi:radical SAM/Cys-rich protein